MCMGGECMKEAATSLLKEHPEQSLKSFSALHGQGTKSWSWKSQTSLTYEEDEIYSVAGIISLQYSQLKGTDPPGT